MNSPHPTDGHLNRVIRESKRKQDSEAVIKARDFWKGVLTKDYSTREKSLFTISAIVDQWDKHDAKTQAAMRDGNHTEDETWKLKVVSQALELVVKALQDWHLNQYSVSFPTK